MDKHLIAKRIREERERCKLSQLDVAKHMGWDSSGHTIVGQVEAGERDLKAWELYKLADLFHIDVEALFKESTTAAETLVLWRNKPAETAATLKERQFLQRCEDYKFLEDLLGKALPIKCSLPIHELDIDAADEDWANELADRVRVQLNLGEFPAAVLPKILEDNYGIRFLNLPLEPGSAACAVYSFGPAILLNENEPKQAFRIAHELFHIITWSDELIRKVTSDKSLEQKIENLAEVFAGALLMPAQLLTFQLKQMIALGVLRYSTIIALASEYKVSPSALLHRMRYLGIITKDLLETILSDTRFQTLEQQNNKLPDSTPSPIGERFTKLACQAYQQFNKISRSRLAKLLGVSLPSIGNILTTYGFTETNDEEIQISHT